MDIVEVKAVRSRAKADNSEQTKPLYRRITDALRERIATGVWAEGDALPSRRALAQELGTTHITIDKAIGQLVKEGLLSATVGSGTYVKGPGRAETAEALPRSARRRIGVVLGTHTFFNNDTSRAKQTPYFSEVLRGIQDAFFGKDVDVNYIGMARGDYDSLLAQDFGGLVIVAPTLVDFADIKLLSTKCKLVAIGLSSDVMPGDDKLPAVDTDNYRGGYDAVRHLLDLGHTHIGLINLSLHQANMYDRYRGYIAALAEAGACIAPEHLLIYPNYGNTSHAMMIERWLTKLHEEGKLPTAIFSCDQAMTESVMDALGKLSIAIPQQMSLVGYDDTVRFEYNTPSITVVRQPLYETGRRAAERLLESLAPDAPSPEGTDHLPCELIIRQSTMQVSAR